jgi:hypothetical protein
MLFLLCFLILFVSIQTVCTGVTIAASGCRWQQTQGCRAFRARGPKRYPAVRVFTLRWSATALPISKSWGNFSTGSGKFIPHGRDMYTISEEFLIADCHYVFRLSACVTVI